MAIRIIKQIFIGSIFLTILALIGFFSYWIFKPAPLPPGESAPLETFQNPEILWVKFFQLNSNTYDLAARIKNHNLEHGAPFLRYTFNLFDKDNNLIKKVQDKNYFLPGEEKYLIKNRVESSQVPVKITLSFEKIEWQILPKEQKIETDFFIIHKELKILKEENNFAEATGILVNKTNYNFASIQITVVLYDFDNQLVAVNRTELSEVHSREERLIKVIWREQFPEKIKAVDAEAYTNLFSKENVF